jgi:uncharacterized protein YkwD
MPRTIPHPARRFPTLASRAAPLALLAACYVTSKRTEPAVTVPPEVAIEEFVTLANGARREAGCPELAWDERAAAVARAHSEDMLRRGYFSHTSPEGVTPFERLRRAGIAFSAAAENIASGIRSGVEVFRRWMGSAGHRRNLLNCQYTRQGVGVAGGVWTQVLFAP